MSEMNGSTPPPQSVLPPRPHDLQKAIAVANCHAWLGAVGADSWPVVIVKVDGFQGATRTARREVIILSKLDALMLAAAINQLLPTDPEETE